MTAQEVLKVLKGMSKYQSTLQSPLKKAHMALGNNEASAQALNQSV